jgi:hypothetical protein
MEQNDFIVRAKLIEENEQLKLSVKDLNETIGQCNICIEQRDELIDKLDARQKTADELIALYKLRIKGLESKTFSLLDYKSRFETLEKSYNELVIDAGEDDAIANVTIAELQEDLDKAIAKSKVLVYDNLKECKELDALRLKVEEQKGIIDELRKDNVNKEVQIEALVEELQRI